MCKEMIIKTYLQKNSNQSNKFQKAALSLCSLPQQGGDAGKKAEVNKKIQYLRHDYLEEEKAGHVAICNAKETQCAPVQVQGEDIDCGLENVGGDSI